MIIYEVFAIYPAFLYWITWDYVVSVNVSRYYEILRKGMIINEADCLLCFIR